MGQRMHSSPARELESSRCLEELSSAVDRPPLPPPRLLPLASQPYREKRKNLQWSRLEPWPGAVKPELRRPHSPPTSEGQEIGVWLMWRGELGGAPATFPCSGHCTPMVASDGGQRRECSS